MSWESSPRDRGASRRRPYPQYRTREDDDEEEVPYPSGGPSYYRTASGSSHRSRANTVHTSRPSFMDRGPAYYHQDQPPPQAYHGRAPVGEGSEVGAFDMQPHMRGGHGLEPPPPPLPPSSSSSSSSGGRRPQSTSTEAQIMELEQEKAHILEDMCESDKQRKQLQMVIREMSKYDPQSPEYQEMQVVFSKLSRSMESSADQEREQELRKRLADISERLHAYRQSRFQPPPPHSTSPENGQVPAHERSHWNSPLTNNSSQGLHDSGIFAGSASEVTSSSRNKLSPYSTGGGTTTSSESSGKMPEQPFMFSSFGRSVSCETNLAPEISEPHMILANVQKMPRKRRQQPRHYASLSQETSISDIAGGRYPFGSGGGPSRSYTTSLSQTMNHPQLSRRDLEEHYYHNRGPRNKPGSPASSSDTSSMNSSVMTGRQSGPASMISMSSISTASSHTSFKGILPRPSMGNSSASMVMSQPNKPSYPEYTTRSRSDVGFKPYIPPNIPHYDPDDDTVVSTPILPSMMKAPHGESSSKRIHPPPPPHGPVFSQDDMYAGHVPMRQKPEDVYKKRRSERKKVKQPKIVEDPELSNRDSFGNTMEMVLSLLAMCGEQNDIGAAKILLVMSQSIETANIMRKMPACMTLLVNILHNVSHKLDNSHHDSRHLAMQTMRNIVQSIGDTRHGKYELCVLGVLEKVRGHCDFLFEMVSTHRGSSRMDPSEVEAVQTACDGLLQLVRKLYKYSNDKEKYRPALLGLGGLEAMAEILIVNYHLISAQLPQLRSGEKPACHSSRVITVTISILINLTYGDGKNKLVLCQVHDFLKSLMFHVTQQNESMIASSAQVLRNLSWRASEDIKEHLLKCDSTISLMTTFQHIKDETTIQHVTSALWNLSAHSVESRRKILSSRTGIRQLVELLSYNSPSGTLAIVENVGGILKNLSVIMQEDKYRRKFREAGGLAKLAQHLKSKNKTVLANATGVLWNLSARCSEDQKQLWDLGCIPLLDVHQTSEHKSIAENARGALRNLLAFGQSNGWTTSRSDISQYNISKSQKELSKSVSISNSYQFDHASKKHSSESLHSRSSQSSAKHTSSSQRAESASALYQAKSDSRSASRRHCADGHSSSSYPYKEAGHRSEDDDVDFAAQNKHRLKLSRIQSAPQTSMKEEWSSYVPESSYVGGGGGGGGGANGGGATGKKHATAVVYKDSSGNSSSSRRKGGSVSGSGKRVSSASAATSAERRSGRHYPYSLSQSISNTELHAVAGSILSPAQLSNDQVASSLSAALDPKLDTFDPMMGGGHPPHATAVYTELEIDEDENDDIDRPALHRDEELHHTSGGDIFGRMRRSSLGRQSPGKSGGGGTCKLALDGTTPKEGAGLDEEGDGGRMGLKRTSDV